MKQAIFSFPAQQSDFFSFERNAYKIIFPNAEAWNISLARLTTYTKLVDEFEKTYIIADNIESQNPLATRARNAAAELLKEALSEIYEKNIVYNDAVSADMKAALHIHYIEGNGGTILPAPRTTPIVSLKSKEISILHFYFSDTATPSTHAKPAGVAFCEFVYKMELPAPETQKDCFDRLYIPRSNFLIVFEQEQRGQKIFGFARWVNKNSKFGPWSDLITAIVP